MKYTEYKISLIPTEPWTEILIAQLSEFEFDTFIEHQDGFSAFITSDKSDEEVIKNHLNNLPKEVEATFETIELEDVNWNQEWESNFEPILVEDTVYLHADFHEKREEIPYQINIQPKMSFGTGHHETTYLMLKMMISVDFKDKSVLDMGCGTSVLAMFAKMKEASEVVAIDIDRWSYENSLENKERNQLEFEVIHGDANEIKDRKFDVILANINKNILLADMQKYTEALNSNGILMMSGIYEFDFDDVCDCAESYNLTFTTKESKNNWIAVQFEKK
ncbi:MAG: 50S ribosomal protein L11 methyltransferase [Flavobacteriales bacterium]|nr:50S ribosomal protein L11 methyltransferase [Flavobacteriales bacterium]